MSDGHDLIWAIFALVSNALFLNVQAEAFKMAPLIAKKTRAKFAREKVRPKFFVLHELRRFHASQNGAAQIKFFLHIFNLFSAIF